LAGIPLAFKITERRKSDEMPGSIFKVPCSCRIFFSDVLERHPMDNRRIGSDYTPLRGIWEDCPMGSGSTDSFDARPCLWIGVVIGNDRRCRLNNMRRRTVVLF